MNELMKILGQTGQAMTFDQIAEAYEAYLARREMLSAAEQAADQSLVAHPAIPPTRHWAAPWPACERDERSSQPGLSASSVTKFAARAHPVRTLLARLPLRVR